MSDPDPVRLAALIVELRRTLRRGPAGDGSDGSTSPSSEDRGTRPRTPSEQEILRYIAAHPGQGTSAIARALRLRPNTVSGLCSALVRDDLLVREADPADRRAARFHLTESAARRRGSKMENRSGRLQEALSQLDPGQRARITEAIPAMEALVEALDDLQSE